jgi:hypothetical protein
MGTTDFSPGIIEGYINELHRYALKKDYLEVDEIKKTLLEHNIKVLQRGEGHYTVEYFYARWLGHYHGIALDIVHYNLGGNQNGST